VVSVEQAVAAPLATRHLHDLGATVIKVEERTRGDFARYYDRALHGSSVQFEWLNGGKRSIALDLKHPDGSAILWRILQRADVFVSNLAPATRERLFPDAHIAQRCPRLIRCYISGYGVDGPYADKKAFDALVQGEAGVTANTGTTAEPARSAVSVADLGAGTYAFGLINAALVRHGRGGPGSRIDVSLFDVLVDWMSPLVLAERNGSPAPPPSGTGHPSIVPYGVYRCRDGVRVNLAVQNEAQWTRLCDDVLQRPDMVAAWPSNAARAARRHELEPLIASVVATLGHEELIARLDRGDIPWGLLNDTAAVARHPQLEDRWFEATTSDGAAAEMLGPPFSMDGAIVNGTAASPVGAPRLGEHTAAILEELSFTLDEITALQDRGVAGPPPAADR
jgi:crotonobetainyl-CoA:carnitine CoA-transferase CaiB-like acyl-CoA transferase